MLYKITVFKEMGNKRKWLYTKEISARDGIAALERACVTFTPDRIVEIRQIDGVDQETRFERPAIKRVQRDAI